MIIALERMILMTYNNLININTIPKALSEEELLDCFKQ